jgi:hypothetical protein
MRNRILHNLSDIVKIEFLHQVEAMRLYGFDAQSNVIGDSSITPAFGDKLQYLAFTRRWP